MGPMAIEPTLIGLPYTWESQVNQYPKSGPPGVSYFRGDLDSGNYVDCLLYRNSRGHVIGILNHFPFESRLTKPGEVLVFVHPRRRRRGIGTALYEEASRLWPDIGEHQQAFTPDGAAFADSLTEKEEV